MVRIMLNSTVVVYQLSLGTVCAFTWSLTEELENQHTNLNLSRLTEGEDNVICFFLVAVGWRSWGGKQVPVLASGYLCAPSWPQARSARIWEALPSWHLLAWAESWLLPPSLSRRHPAETTACFWCSQNLAKIQDLHIVPAAGLDEIGQWLQRQHGLTNPGHDTRFPQELNCWACRHVL